MLLLTTVTFGGTESIGAFDHLPDEEGELLRHRAQELLKIPREKRIPLLVQEIKRLVTARRGQVWSADPERLAQVLRRERPLLVEVVLRALPFATADAVRKHLPPAGEPVKLVRDIKPQILNILRWKLEEGLVRAAPKRPGFKFSDLLLLKSREVLTVCDRLGARSLALAIAGLPEQEREAFLARLNPDQRHFAAKLATHASARALRPEDARQLLAVHHGEKDPAAAIRSAGAQRLARASLAQSPEFAARLMERHPGPFGALLLKWIREERPRITGRVDGGRTDVVQELERLEQKGIIDKPVRLAPPPRKEPPPRPASSQPPSAAKSRAAPNLPGGRLMAPPPRPSRPGPQQQDAKAERPPIHRMPEPPDGRRPSGGYRDPIAERQARKAGVSMAQRSAPDARRDPIAEREARRAGAMSAKPPPLPRGERASANPSKILRALPRQGEPSASGAAPRPGEVKAVGFNTARRMAEQEPSVSAGRVVNPIGRLPGRPRTASAVDKPPVRRTESTSVARPPKSRGPGRGPGGSSG